MKRLLTGGARCDDLEPGHARTDGLHGGGAPAEPDWRPTDRDRLVLAALDVLPMHVAILDSAGTIRAVNAHWRGYCGSNGGTDAACGVGVSYLDTCRRAVARGDLAAGEVATAIDEMLAGRRATFEHEYPCHAPDRLGWYVVRLAPFAVGDAACVLATHQDVTQRKLANTTIERLSRIVERTRHSVMVLDADGRVDWMNDAFVAASGLPAEEIVGRRLADVVARDTEDCAVAEAVNHAIAAKCAGTVLMRRQSRGGGTSWAELRIDPVRGADGEVHDFIVVETDATERRELELEIELAARRERERLARDLHDGLGQELVGAQLLLSAAIAARTPQAMQDSLGRAQRALERATNTAREVAHGISPVELGSGLGRALEVLGERMEVDGALEVHVRCEEEAAATAHAAEPLYHIAQEALANAIRHGHAHRVDIRLAQRRHRLVLEVHDDGIGFRAGHAAPGLGLRAMRHRAESIGGHLRVESTPGTGTTIRCSVPA